jgi:outer membrane immunogenic protein
MIKKISAVSALALVASVSAPALAQDAGVAFDGPYVAAMGGYDKVRIDTPAGGGSDDGVLFGGVVGFDKNINGAVFGIEGEYSDSNVKETVRDLLVSGDRASFKTGRDLYAGIRIGGEVMHGVMLYAKGGYTNAKVTASYAIGNDVDRGSDKLEGYRLGAGVETTVQGLIGRLEYRYSDYGNYEGIGLEPDRHQVAAMIGYRF